MAPPAFLAPLAVSLRAATVFAGSPLPLARPRHARLASRCRVRSTVMTPVMAGEKLGTDPQDVLLGELAFTEPQLLPNLVRERLSEGRLTDEFYDYVETRVQASADLEERETLRMLVAAVKQLVDEARGVGPTVEVDAGPEEDPMSADEKAMLAYDAIIERFLGAAKEEDAERALFANIEYDYDSIDKRFLDRLDDKVAEAGSESEDRKGYILVKEAIANAMSKRVAEAAERLKEILTAGSPGDMNNALERINLKGGLDDAIVLLLQANIDQAKQAGMEPAVKVMTGLLDYASKLKEAKLSQEVRLIRKLLRTDDDESREDLLMTALKPNKGVMLADGTVTSGVRVNGKKFVQELRTLIDHYSNVEEAFAMRLSALGEQSETVARKLFDMEEKDVSDLQEEAFHKRSVSVWDLEQVEMREEVEGRKADWEGRLGQMPSGFDEHGKMAI